MPLAPGQPFTIKRRLPGGSHFTKPKNIFLYRSGRAKGTSFKDIQKEMELFKKTGRHPELEAQQQAASTVVPTLPDVDMHRPHVFMDLQQSRRLLGALIFRLLPCRSHIAAASLDLLLRLLALLSATLAAGAPSAQHSVCLQAGWLLRFLRSCCLWRQGTSSHAASRAAQTRSRAPKCIGWCRTWQPLEVRPRSEQCSCLSWCQKAKKWLAEPCRRRAG